MRKELEIETLEEIRQSLRLILMYNVVDGLVPALPTDAFQLFHGENMLISNEMMMMSFALF